jgi:2-polyprenyl-3-methyl-5-hydroxy-6-metoxy-1,4-benzoquinol methylase
MIKSLIAFIRKLVKQGVNLVRRLLNFFLNRWLKNLSTPQLESLICQLASQRADKLPAEEALRFLFRLDAELYALQGKKAVEYGMGLHTKHRHLQYHDFFVSRIHPEERVLDIGCGIGAVAYDVAEKAGAFVTGIDLSHKNIAQACERYHHPRCRFVIGDALKELPGEHFDVIILSNVLEHLTDRSAFLKRVQVALQPSRILIRVPLYERDWRVPLKKELKVEWRLDPTHKTEYTPESFVEEMATAHLRIIHQEIRWGEIWAEVVPDGS